MASVTIGGTALNIRPFAAPSISRAILWDQNSAGYWMGSDRGAAQDIYSTSLVIQATDSTFNTIQTTVNSNREGVTLSAFLTDVFAPTVDQTGSVSCSILDFGERKHIAFAGAAAGVFGVTLGLRAISPTLLTPTPSLATLRLLEGWEGDHTTEIGKGFAYDQTATYSDRKSDVGAFTGRFSQTTTELKAILAYIMVTARAAAFVMPTLSGASYPFGVAKGNGAFNVKIKDFSFTRANLNRWNLMIKFVESV